MQEVINSDTDTAYRYVNRISPLRFIERTLPGEEQPFQSTEISGFEQQRRAQGLSLRQQASHSSENNVNPYSQSPSIKTTCLKPQHPSLSSPIPEEIPRSPSRQRLAEILVRAFEEPGMDFDPFSLTFGDAENYSDSVVLALQDALCERITRRFDQIQNNIYSCDWRVIIIDPAASAQAESSALTSENTGEPTTVPNDNLHSDLPTLTSVNDPGEGCSRYNRNSAVTHRRAERSAVSSGSRPHAQDENRQLNGTSRLSLSDYGEGCSKYNRNGPSGQYPRKRQRDENSAAFVNDSEFLASINDNRVHLGEGIVDTSFQRPSSKRLRRSQSYEEFQVMQKCWRWLDSGCSEYFSDDKSESSDDEDSEQGDQSVIYVEDDKDRERNGKENARNGITEGEENHEGDEDAHFNFNHSAVTVCDDESIICIGYNADNDRYNRNESNDNTDREEAKKSRNDGDCGEIIHITDDEEIEGNLQRAHEGYQSTAAYVNVITSASGSEIRFENDDDLGCGYIQGDVTLIPLSDSNF